MMAKDELGFNRGTSLFFHGNYSYHADSLGEFASKIMKVLRIAEDLGVEERFIHDCDECGFYCLGSEGNQGWDLSDEHTVEDLKIYMLQHLMDDLLKSYFSEDEKLYERYIRNPDQKIYVVLDLRERKE